MLAKRRIRLRSPGKLRWTTSVPVLLATAWKTRPTGFSGGASRGAGYAGDADAECRFATVADAFGEGGGDFAADGAVAVDHFRGDSGEFCLQSVGVDDGAAEKIARAAADGGDAFGEQASGAGFGDGDRGVAHLQPVADDLLERFAVAGVDGVVEFVFDHAGDFVDAALGGVLRGGDGFEVQFDFSGAGEDGGLDVGVALVDGRDAGVDGGLSEHRDLQRADRREMRAELWRAGARELRLRTSAFISCGGPGSRTMMCSRPSN